MRACPSPQPVAMTLGRSLPPDSELSRDHMRSTSVYSVQLVKSVFKLHFFHRDILRCAKHLVIPWGFSSLCGYQPNDFKDVLVQYSITFCFFLGLLCFWLGLRLHLSRLGWCRWCRLGWRRCCFRLLTAKETGEQT